MYLPYKQALWDTSRGTLRLSGPNLTDPIQIDLGVLSDKAEDAMLFSCGSREIVKTGPLLTNGSKGNSSGEDVQEKTRTNTSATRYFTITRSEPVAWGQMIVLR